MTDLVKLQPIPWSPHPSHHLMRSVPRGFNPNVGLADVDKGRWEFSFVDVGFFETFTGAFFAMSM